jgi:hypothetical protein
MADVATASTAPTTATTTEVAGPKGLGGWLILLMLGQIGSILRVLKSVADDVSLYKSVDRVAAINAELILNLLLLAIVVYVTVAMFRTKRSFPKLWICQGVVAILVPWIDILMVAALLGLSADQLVDGKDIAQTFGGIVGVSLWSWYLNVSVRVKNTFVN